MDFFEGVLASGIRLTIPIGFAALGELVAERAGVLNIGLEGYMAAGAFTGVTVAATTGSSAAGVLVALAAGIVAALAMALLSVRIGASQIISGFAVLFATLGIVDFLAAQRASGRITIETVPLPDRWAVPLLADIPVIGRGLFDHNAFYWVLLLLGIAVWWLLTRTGLGLAITAAGHDPDVLAAKGINPIRIRTAAVAACGALAALGGAALSIGSIGSFTPGQINGRGFVAIAVVILGRWRMPAVLGAAAVFGLSEALQLRLQDHVDIPVQLLGTLPWLVVIAMLTIGLRSKAEPHALGTNYRPLKQTALEARLRRFVYAPTGRRSR